jgi:hypothetical protein
MSVTTIPDAADRLLTFLDAPAVAYSGVAVVALCVLVVVITGAVSLVRTVIRQEPAAHRPALGRQRPTVPAPAARREPQHRAAEVTQQLTAHPYPAYLGPEHTDDRTPALAG